MSKVYKPEQIIRDEDFFINNTASVLQINKGMTVEQAKVLNTVVTTNSASVENIFNYTFLISPQTTIASEIINYENQIKDRLEIIAGNTNLVIGSEGFYEEINSLANEMLSKYPIYEFNWYRILSEANTTLIAPAIRFLIEALELLVVEIEARSNVVPLNTTDILNDEVTIEGSDIIRQIVDQTALGETVNAVGVTTVTSGMTIVQRNYMFANLLLPILQAVPRTTFYNTYNPAQIKINRTADFRNYLENTSTFEDFQKDFLSNFGRPVPELITKIVIANIFADVIDNRGTISIRNLSNKLDAYLLANNIIRL